MNQILRTLAFRKNVRIHFWMSVVVVFLSWQTSAAQFSVLLDASNPLCGAINSGSVTALPTNGVPPFTYLWSTGDTTQTINLLGPGFYEVTVTDAANSVAIASVTLTSPPPMFVDLTVSSCTLPVVITAETSGGVPPYKFMWSTGDTTQTTGVLDPGTYCVTVCDSNNCGYVTCTDITGVPPSLEVIATDALCAGDTSGTLEAIVTGGTPPYLFVWDTGDSTAVLTGLSAGVYSVTVTDGNGCTDDAVGQVFEPDPLQIVLNTLHPTCQGFADGSLTAQPSGGTPPYSFLWNTGDTLASISNLGAGVYAVTVTDANGCTGEASTVLDEQSDITVIAEATDINCFGINDGTATAMAANGVPPYLYLWSSNASGPMIDGLAPGVYSVTATDDLGCTASDTVEVLDANPFFLEMDAQDVTMCGGSDGWAKAIPSGGAPPYAYLWTTGDTTMTVFGLPEGTYGVTVTDSNGCELIDEITVMDPPDIEVLVTGTNEICLGNQDGTATATPMGTPPFSYLWSNGDTTQQVTGLAAGDYTVVVTDASGCMGSGSITILPGDEVVVTITSTDVTCQGANDGTASASASGGTQPYTYAWSNNATTADIQDLGPGDYTVVVTDANGCEGQASVTISEPDALILLIETTDVSCPGGNDGVAMVTPTGGTGPYTYLWSNNFDGPVLAGISTGTYGITVTDANGCVATGMATVNEPAPFQITIIEQDASCVGAMNGTLTANVMGGTPPYSFEWSNGAMIAIAQNLDPGDYDLTVTDANGCEAFASGTVGISNDLTVMAEVLTQPCAGTNTGSAFATPSGGEQPYNLNWSNGDMGLVAMDLIPGTYTVTVTDDLGCMATDNVTIEALEVPTCDAVVVQEITIPGANDGIVSVNVTGGEMPYSFLWSNNETTQTISGLDQGIYSVTITDANGCTSNCSVSLGAPPSAKVGDKVWEDYNENGIQNPGEPGVPNVLVSLSGTDYLGNPFNASTLTNGNGNYLFDPIPPGTYKLTFSLPLDYYFSPQDVGANDGVDSDVDTLTGMTDFFTLVDGDCDLTWDAGIHLFCINVTDPGTICCDEYLCGPGNDPAPIYETAPATGGVGALEYLWMMSTVSDVFDPNTWTTIPNSNAPSYDPGPIQVTTYYIRCVRRAGCINYLESNPVKKEVGDEAVADISGPSTVCVDELATFTAPNNGPGASYSWAFGPNSTPPTANTQSADVSWSQFGLVNIQLTVENNDCISTDVFQVFVTNSPTFCDDPGINLTGEMVDNEQVALFWTAPGVGGTGVFLVEKSKDGQDFQLLGWVQASEGDSQYQFLDADPMPGYNHYRVRYEEQQDTKMYSNQLEMLMPMGNTKALLYPNPVVDDLILELLSDNEEAGIIEIYSLAGQKLAVEVLAAGTKQQIISTNILPAGTYLLVLRQGANGVETLKFVKY